MNRPNFARIVTSLLEGMTETELAAKCRVNQSTINRLKKGSTVDPGYLVGARIIDLHDRRNAK
jgi:predicted transcriptional regulator